MDLYPTVVHAWDEFLFPIFLYSFAIVGILALAGKSSSKSVVKAEPVVLPEPEPVVEPMVEPMVEPVVVTTAKRRGRPPKANSAGEQPAKKTKRKSAAARAAEVPSEVPDYSKGVCRDTLKCIFEDT
jgi:hypothetical protein